MNRAREHIEGRSDGELERRLLELVHGLKPAAHPLERFVVKASGRVFFVRASEIEWIEAAGNYVKLHVGAESHLFRETMNAVEEKLDPDLFYRIHRSHIVNIERVRELQPSFNGEYLVCLKSGARLTLSRGYREKLQERIGRTSVARTCPPVHFVHPIDHAFLPSRSPCAKSIRTMPAPGNAIRSPAPVSNCARVSPPSSTPAARAASANTAGATRSSLPCGCTQCRHSAPP